MLEYWRVSSPAGREESHAIAGQGLREVSHEAYLLRSSVLIPPSVVLSPHVFTCDDACVAVLSLSPHVIQRNLPTAYQTCSLYHHRLAILAYRHSH